MIRHRMTELNREAMRRLVLQELYQALKKSRSGGTRRLGLGQWERRLPAGAETAQGRHLFLETLEMLEREGIISVRWPVSERAKSWNGFILSLRNFCFQRAASSLPGRSMMCWMCSRVLTRRRRMLSRLRAAGPRGGSRNSPRRRYRRCDVAACRS
jgi:hypothetical protein